MQITQILFYTDASVVSGGKGVTKGNVFMSGFCIVPYGVENHEVEFPPNSGSYPGCGGLAARKILREFLFLNNY